MLTRARAADASSGAAGVVVAVVSSSARAAIGPVQHRRGGLVVWVVPSG